MPLKKCVVDGKSGWKYGDNGHCYPGKNGKKEAIKQWVAMTYNGFKGDVSHGTLNDIRQEIIAFGLSEQDAEIIISEVLTNNCIVATPTTHLVSDSKHDKE